MKGEEPVLVYTLTEAVRLLTQSQEKTTSAMRADIARLEHMVSEQQARLKQFMKTFGTMLPGSLQQASRLAAPAPVTMLQQKEAA
jgi:hypothetical protein